MKSYPDNKYRSCCQDSSITLSIILGTLNRDSPWRLYSSHIPLYSQNIILNASAFYCERLRSLPKAGSLLSVSATNTTNPLVNFNKPGVTDDLILCFTYTATKSLAVRFGGKLTRPIMKLVTDQTMIGRIGFFTFATLFTSPNKSLPYPFIHAVFLNQGGVNVLIRQSCWLEWGSWSAQVLSHCRITPPSWHDKL